MTSRAQNLGVSWTRSSVNRDGKWLETGYSIDAVLDLKISEHPAPVPVRAAIGRCDALVWCAGDGWRISRLWRLDRPVSATRLAIIGPSSTTRLIDAPVQRFVRPNLASVDNGSCRQSRIATTSTMSSDTR